MTAVGSFKLFEFNECHLKVAETYKGFLTVANKTLMLFLVLYVTVTDGNIGLWMTELICILEGILSKLSNLAGLQQSLHYHYMEGRQEIFKRDHEML